jgi:hypothetical protein
MEQQNSFKTMFDSVIQKFGIFAIKITLYVLFFIILFGSIFFIIKCNSNNLKDRIWKWFNGRDVSNANSISPNRPVPIGQKDIDGSIQIPASDILFDKDDPSITIVHGKKIKLPRGIYKDSIKYLILLESNAIYVVTSSNKNVLDLLKYKE